MSGFVENVKGKVAGWLSDTFGYSAPFSAQTVLTAQAASVLFASAKKDAGSNTIDNARYINSLLGAYIDKTSPQETTFRRAYRDLFDLIVSADEEDGIVINDSILLDLYENASCITRLTDRLVTTQRLSEPASVQAIIGKMEERPGIDDAQTQIAALNGFHTRLHEWLSQTDIPQKSAIRVKEARLETNDIFQRMTERPANNLPKEWRL